MCFSLSAKEVVVKKGQVVSKKDDLTVLGLNILIFETSIGTIADFDGNYQIQPKRKKI